jgi:hypothetical protein
MALSNETASLKNPKPADLLPFCPLPNKLMHAPMELEEMFTL